MRTIFYAVGACALLVPEALLAERSGTYSVSEYGLLVTFPAGAKVCESISGTHLHGWGTPFSGNCEHSNRGMTVLANYNAAFLKSASEATYCSTREGGSLAKGAALKLSFSKHRSATCFEEEPNGKILITVATQAWRWPEPADSEARQSALINYNAYLRTTRGNLPRDLPRFRAILGTVQIRPPEEG